MSTLCLLLGYSRQAFYGHQRYLLKEALESELIIQEVLKHREIHRNIGTRKLVILLDRFLKDHRITLGRDALFDLLREENLLIRKGKRGVRTTFSRHRLKKYPNCIKNYLPLAPNRLWASDITYLVIAKKYGYLSLITDVYSKKIVGFYLSEKLEASGCVMALQMAMNTTDKFENLIHHSDRGAQYCSHEYVMLLESKNIKISMTETGDPLDNAVAERVNGILKGEYLEEVYSSFPQTEKSVSRAITIYNSLRPHSSCEMKTPDQAHQCTGPLKRRWKSYYKKKEVIME